MECPLDQAPLRGFLPLTPRKILHRNLMVSCRVATNCHRRLCKSQNASPMRWPLLLVSFDAPFLSQFEEKGSLPFVTTALVKS